MGVSPPPTLSNTGNEQWELGIDSSSLAQAELVSEVVGAVNRPIVMTTLLEEDVETATLRDVPLGPLSLQPSHLEAIQSVHKG